MHTLLPLTNLGWVVQAPSGTIVQHNLTKLEAMRLVNYLNGGTGTFPPSFLDFGDKHED